MCSGEIIDSIRRSAGVTRDLTLSDDTDSGMCIQSGNDAHSGRGHRRIRDVGHRGYPSEERIGFKPVRSTKSFTLITETNALSSPTRRVMLEDTFGEPEDGPAVRRGRQRGSTTRSEYCSSQWNNGEINGFTDPSERFETVSTNPSGAGGLSGFGLAPGASASATVRFDAQAATITEGDKYDLGVELVNAKQRYRYTLYQYDDVFVGRCDALARADHAQPE